MGGCGCHFCWFFDFTLNFINYNRILSQAQNPGQATSGYRGQLCTQLWSTCFRCGAVPRFSSIPILQWIFFSHLGWCIQKGKLYPVFISFGRACFPTTLKMLAAGQLFVMSIWVGVCRGYASFIYPGYRDQNLTFNYIDVVYFTWTSSIDGPWMNLCVLPIQALPNPKITVSLVRSMMQLIQERPDKGIKDWSEADICWHCVKLLQYTTNRCQVMVPTLNPSRTAATNRKASATCKWKASRATTGLIRPPSTLRPTTASNQAHGDLMNWVM